MKISQNPDGSLQRAAMMQVQKARERKDIRDQKQLDKLTGLSNKDLNKIRDDPTANSAARDMVQIIRNMYQ